MRKIKFFIALIFIVQLFVIQPVYGEKEALEIDLNLEEQDLAYTFFDLSNGEATLLQSGKGQNLLIDTGSKETKEELEQRLKMYHVQKIETVIITNQSEEYIGNLEWIIDQFKVKKLIIPEVIKKQIVQNLNVGNVEVIAWKKGDKAEIIPYLNSELLYVEERDHLDQGAIVLYFSYGKQKLLFMGIADEEVEKQLVEQYALKSTILKVADFGSEKGTSQLFLDEVDPQVAILFKKDGTPVSELVLERLQETWIDIYQTNRFGTVSIKCDNDDYEIFTVRPEEEEFSFGLAKNISKLFSK